MKGGTPFGTWLKRQRHAADLSQRELARQVGCAEVTIRKLEAGRLQPSKELAERLAACLGIAPEAYGPFVHFARGRQPASSRQAGVPAPANLTQHRHNLPFPLTQLIGREADLAAVRKRLHEGARLVTLAGPPGIGKTRLALEVAYQELEGYPDGVFFVDLVPVADPALVADAIGRALNISEARARPMVEQIKSYLREKESLLVVDNFEHVVDAAPLVAELLAACPWLTILATSRQPLRIRGEREYPVAPLAVPEEQAEIKPSISAADALRHSAIALFVERAEAAVPGFALTDAGAASAASVVEICRRLDGVPLAIELVAAHLRLVSPAELLERWTGTWVRSSGWLRDAPARHETLDDAVHWSYRLLVEGEKSLLCRLAVFAGGADLRAIEAVCECHDFDRLAALVEKSLVKRVTDPEGEARYMLLEMIREYALKRLAADGQEAGVRIKHAAYYRRLAAEGRQGIAGPEQMLWFRRLEREQPNLRAALSWTLSRDPQAERLAVDLGVQTALDLFWFWSIRGHLREGLDWLERIQTVTAGWGETPARADALWGAGACAGYLGLGHKSRACFEACLNACHSLITHYEAAGGEPIPANGLLAARRGMGYALQLRAFFSTERENLAPIRADLEQSVALMREAGDEFDLAYALNSLGHWASRNGELQLARPALKESYALFLRTSNVWGGTLAFGNLGRVFEYLGQFEQFRTLITAKGLPAAVVQELGEMQRIHVVMWWLSYLAGSADDAVRRFEVFRQAVGLQQATGYQSFVEGSLYETVYLALQAGMPARAVRLAAATEGWLEGLGLHLAVPKDLQAALAEARARLGEGLFVHAWAEGHAMTIPESAAYALSGEE